MIITIIFIIDSQSRTSFEHLNCDIEFVIKSIAECQEIKNIIGKNDRVIHLYKLVIFF